MDACLYNNTRRRRSRRSRGRNPGTLSLLADTGRFETKHLDVAINPTNATTTLSAQWLTGLVTGGSTSSTRVGNSIRIKAILVDLWVTSGGNSNCVRGMLTKSLNGQQGTPVLANWYLPLDGDTFYPLKERRINISNSASTAITKPLRMFHKFRGLGEHIHYDSASASSEISPRIMLSVVSDAAAATYPTYEGYVRIFFEDA